jgi:hypothetical protein
MVSFQKSKIMAKKKSEPPKLQLGYSMGMQIPKISMYAFEENPWMKDDEAFKTLKFDKVSRDYLIRVNPIREEMGIPPYELGMLDWRKLYYVQMVADTTYNNPYCFLSEEQRRLRACYNMGLINKTGPIVMRSPLISEAVYWNKRGCTSIEYCIMMYREMWIMPEFSALEQWKMLRNQVVKVIADRNAGVFNLSRHVFKKDGNTYTETGREQSASERAFFHKAISSNLLSKCDEAIKNILNAAGALSTDEMWMAKLRTEELPEGDMYEEKEEIKEEAKPDNQPAEFPSDRFYPKRN